MRSCRPKSNGMNRGGIDRRIHNFEIQTVLLRNRLPISYAGPAEWIDAELQTGSLDHRQIDDLVEITHVRGHIIMPVRR